MKYRQRIKGLLTTGCGGAYLPGGAGDDLVYYAVIPLLVNARMEIPATPSGPATSSTTASSTIAGSSAATAATSRSEQAAMMLTVSAYVQSAQPTSAAPATPAAPVNPATPTTQPPPAPTGQTAPAPVTQQVIGIQPAPPPVAAAPTVTSATNGSMPATYLLDLLVNTTRPAAAVATVAQVNAQAIKLIAQGQVVRMLSQSPVPVPQGSVLQLQLAPGTSPRISRIDPPEILPQELRTFIARALTTQGSPAPLLQLMQRALSAPASPQVLPEGVRQIGHQLMALFPDAQSLRREGALAGFLQKSGLFMESSLADMARAALSDTSAATTAPEQDTAVPPEKAASSLLRMLGQLREQLRGSNTDTAPETPDKNPEKSPPASTANATPQRATPSLSADYKALLLQLQQQLNTARSQGQTSETQHARPAPPTGAPLSPTPIPPSTSQPPGMTPLPPPVTEGVATGGSIPVGDTDGAAATPTPAIPTAPGKLPTPANDKGLPAGEAPPTDTGDATTPDTTTRTAPHPRLARAADHYQRVEQLTRPTQTAAATSVAAVDAHQEDLLLPWTEAMTDLDIPGIGLPLPHRQKTRSEDKGDSLDNLVGLLLKRTQEALNRLHLHQLSHAGTTARDAAQTTQNPPLTFDLPVFFDGQVQVFNTRIEEEELPSSNPETPDKKVRQWSVSLGFDIEGLGPMFCQLKMTEQQANLQFWADRPATLALTRDNLGFLSKSLHDLGVSVSEVSCHEGMPKQTKTRLSQQLVDINT